MNRPVFSIIVPCYHQAQYLHECLQSVIGQTNADWECIIVNDGSPDNTKEVANNFLISDDRFKYIEIENGGVSNARNKGIEKAKGKYILPLDADDKIAPNYLELGLQEFNKDTTLKIVYCKAKFFGLTNKLWKLPDYSFTQLLKSNVIFCSALFKKEDFVKSGGYDVNLTKGLEDWEFWINFLKDGSNVYRIPKVCFYYRIKEQSRNVEIYDGNFEEVLKYISIKHARVYIENFGSFTSLLDKNNELTKENIRLKKANKLTVISVLKRLKKSLYG